MMTASKIVRAHALLVALHNFRTTAGVQAVDALFNALGDLEVLVDLKKAVLLRFVEMTDFSEENMTREAVKAVLDTEL